MNPLEIALCVIAPALAMIGMHYAPARKPKRLVAYIFWVGVLGLTITGLWLNDRDVAGSVVIAWFWIATAAAAAATMGCYAVDSAREKNKVIADWQARHDA